MSETTRPDSRPSIASGLRARELPFQTHVDLLQTFLAQRAAIVERLGTVLNCQKLPLEYQQDRALLNQQFKACFFAPGSISQAQVLLADQLEQAHWAGGFKPRAKPGNDLVNPVEMLIRGFHMWRQTRWPGSKGRMHFAHTLFNLYLLRLLALMTLRLWDEGMDGVPARLTQLQSLLDALCQGSPDDQPRLVKDIRWLPAVAMSPTTDALSGYFEVAEKIALSFNQDDLVEAQRAWVLTGAGHLRSQLRTLSVRREVPIDDLALVLITRMSNALDVTLLMEGLVVLLAAYERALHSGEEQQRRILAAAICQGISPDPLLFLERLDLLLPYTMIEYLFITTDDAGQGAYTHMGERHLRLLEEYKALLPRVVQALLDDSVHSRPVEGQYSPYGALYGFSSNLVELIAFKSLQRDAMLHFSLEDVFTPGAADKLAWVNGWRDLPHVKAEVVQQFVYPASFAAAMAQRVESALQACAAGNAAPVAGKLYLLPEEGEPTAAELSGIADLPLRFIQSSDAQLVAAGRAEAKDPEDLLHCRIEGEYLVSYESPQGWVGISKDLLTEVLGSGQNARLRGLPGHAMETLRLMCPDLVERVDMQI